MFSFLSSIYFLSLIGIAIIMFAILFALKDIKNNKQRIVIIVFAWINFAIHFLKILIPPYSDILVSGAANNFPNSITNLTAENICAINTLLLPFAINSKHKGFSDSVLLISFIGGIAAIIYPIDIMTYTLPVFEICRYYLCHILLTIIPLMTLIYKINTLTFKSWYKLPLFLLLEMLIVFVNDQLLMEIGLYPFRSNFLNVEYYNSAFVYGPYFKSPTEPIKIIDILVPSIFKVVPDGFNYSGELKYWPVIWAIVPCLVYLLPLSFIVFLIFGKKKSA